MKFFDQLITFVTNRRAKGEQPSPSLKSMKVNLDTHYLDGTPRERNMVTGYDQEKKIMFVSIDLIRNYDWCSKNFKDGDIVYCFDDGNYYIWSSGGAVACDPV